MPTTPPKKDFAGENKTKDTYDADWVFVRDKHPYGNVNNSAWMTKRQRKQLHYEKQQANAARLAASKTPGTPAAPTTVPIPLGGPTSPAPTPTTPTNTTPGVPSWWIGQAYQNPTTEEQKFANVANALLPTLAPEDQRTLATYLAQNYKDVYGGYANATFDAAPTEITDAVRNQYLSPQRAQTAISLLDRMKQASGTQDMGAGYDYLKNAVNLINQFTTGGVMTRERYQQFQNAVTNLNKTVGSGVSAYANLAQLFNMPQFTAGPLVSNTPNDKLFS